MKSNKLFDTALKLTDTVINEHSPVISSIWSYDAGLTLMGIAEIYKKTNEKKYFEYILSSMNALISADATVKSYDSDAFNIDYINQGNTCLWLYNETHEGKFLKVVQMLRRQLDNQPKTKSGVYFHKKVYPNQVWLDGLFMAEPFNARYISQFAPQEGYSEIEKQFLTATALTYDARTGLYTHACDESRSIFWADKVTGRSLNVWGRALGWLCMALADVLEIIPDNAPEHSTLSELFVRVIDNIIKYQSESGAWYQVIDSRHKDNYKEATCTAMFAYSINKGIKASLLTHEKHTASLYSAIRSLNNDFIRETQSGTFLTGCCAVAGLGPENHTERNGTLEYYFSEPVRDNDFKGVGAFLKLACEFTE